VFSSLLPPWIFLFSALPSPPSEKGLSGGLSVPVIPPALTGLTPVLRIGEYSSGDTLLFFHTPVFFFLRIRLDYY